MAQLTLFGSSESILADDERGRIAYTPRFVDTATADEWFAELRHAVDWRALRRTMYEREVEVPRLIGHYRLDPPAESTPGAILDAFRRVADGLEVPFNSVGLNLYRDGRDSVSWHADNEPGLGRDPVIASVSLGAARWFQMKHRRRAARVGLDLPSGSCLVMAGATQHHWLHQVPKTSRPVGPRINLTFRAMATAA
jgi:alkylated DNA repair dioxygenase AlkB